MDTTPTRIKCYFKYNSKNCSTKEEMETALNYYLTTKDQVPETQVNTWNDLVKSFSKKLNVEQTHILEALSQENLDENRIFFYHYAIILSVEFLKAKPDGELLDKLFHNLKLALALTGEPWDNKMYTDNVYFAMAYTPGERKVFFINKIVESGLHERKQLIHIINMYIKLINILHLREIISVDLPCRKDLHNVSFEIPNFSY